MTASTVPACRRCGVPLAEYGSAVRFVVAFKVAGEAAGPWCDSGDLCEPCALLARRAIFGVLDVAPGGGAPCAAG